MDNLEQLSRYLRELCNDGKFENALINFQSNKDKFAPEDIASNQYLITDILKASRKARNYEFGFDFLDEFQINLADLEAKFCLNTYGWLLHDKLKDEGQNGSLPKESTDLLMELLPLLDLEDQYGQNLFSNLVFKVTVAEKKGPEPNIAIVWKVFKAVNFQDNKAAILLVRNDEYIVTGVLDVLKKSKRFEWAFNFLKMINLELSEATADRVLNAYGWLLYSKLKAESENLQMPSYEVPDTLIIDYADTPVHGYGHFDASPLSLTLKCIGESLSWYSQEDEYSPFALLFRKYLKVQKQKSNTNWQDVLDVLDKFDPATLSTKCEVMQVERKGRVRDMELASVKEDWYAYYTRATFEVGQFQQCYEACSTAMATIENLHYDNEIWFARRIAHPKKELGDPETALSDLQEILKRKKEWFILHEIAKLYFDQGSIDTAFNYAIDAALAFGQLEHKCGLFYLMGYLFIAKNQNEIGYKHFLLSKLLREEQGWKLPIELKSALTEHKDEKIAELNGSSKEVLAELKMIWSHHRPQRKDNNLLKGRINSIREDRGFGFIKCDNGEDYYFKLHEFKAPKSKLVFNARVEFSLRSSKGKRQKDIAVNVKPLN